MLGLYIGIILLLNIPYVQHRMSVLVAKELSTVLGSELTVGRINIGLLNRIIIDDLVLNDQSGKELLKIGRLSAKFEILPLFSGKISIGNVQLFSFNANLERPTPQASTNFQFVLDAFASKDTVKKKSNLDLRINSLLIRRGKVSYDVLSAESTPGKFNPQHIRLSNILANISLKALQNDSVNAAIKRMSVEEEHSGFELKKLSLKIIANDRKMRIENFAIDLPNTSLAMDTIRMEYDSLESLGHFTDDVRFSFRMLPSEVALQDISAFVPAFKPFKEKLKLEMEAAGTVNRLNCPKLLISSNDHFLLKGNVSLQDLSHPQDAYIFGNLSNLYADPDGIAFFVRNLSKDYKGVPPVLQNLGTVSFRGEISGYFTDLVTYGEVRTDIGTIKTDVKLSSDKDKGYFAYSGAVKTTGFELGRMLNNDKFGKVTFNMDVKGNHYAQRYPAITMKGLVASIDYSDYTYEDITLDGEYKQGGFNGNVSLNDENGAIQLNGSINTAGKTPTFNFRAAIDHFRPNTLHLTPKYKDTELAVKIKADFTGSSINDMNGEINVDSLQYIAPEQNFFMDNLRIAATQGDERQKRLTISSNFLRGTIEGDYSYQTLPASVLNIMRRYIPALIQPARKPQKTENNFHFDLHIYDTEILSTVFQIPLKVYTHSTLKGYFNDKAQRLRVEGYFPRLSYGGKFFESGVVLCENPGEQFQAKVRFTNRKTTGAVNVALEAKAKDDRIQTVFNWGNSSAVTYSGKVAALTQFVRNSSQEAGDDKIHTKSSRQAKKEKPALKTIVNVQETNVILNDTVWKIHPSQIVVDSGKVHVNNFYFSHKERHLQIEADSTNLKFIHHYMQSITPEFNGRASGHVHFYGKFKALTMEGRVFGDASLKVDVLNTTFSLKDSILIEPGGLTFRNNRIFDTQGHQGRANGYLHYRHFKDLEYRFRFDVDNMLVMNTKESPDFPFYGTVYGTGNATIAGNAADGVNIDVAMTTNRNTNFTYMKEGVASAVSNQFIRFVDKTPRRVLQDSIMLMSEYEQAQKEVMEKESDTDIRLNLLIDATPDATMKIIMDPIAGDYISGKGTGNIRTEFYNKGDVKMFGSYRISQGVYKFSLQEVIRKDFIIKDGSTITFNGAPLNATLDIQAGYLVNSASLNDLVPDAGNYVNQTNIKVNCLMALTGQLTSPDIKMSLELPNERDEVQALVRNYIPTDEQMNMQILYLLGIGKFYTPENVDATGNSNMMSSVLSSTLSGQLNNALSQIIDSNNWNFGTNFSTGEKGWTDMEFETMLSGQLLNNRLLINGNFGYRDNPMANTNFVGDFQAEWLVNRSGDIRLKAYNETNDRYYTKTNLTTQGIGIIFKKDFNKWNELLFWNKWKLKRLKRKQVKEDTSAPDSIPQKKSRPEAQSKRERKE